MLKKFVLLISLLILFLSSNNAQEDYFNLRIDMSQNSFVDGASEGLLAVNEGYIITGFTMDENNAGLCKSICLLNKNGSVKEIKKICFDEGDYVTGNPGSLIQFNESRYYSTGNHRIPTSDWVHDRGMLICYDEQMNPLWNRYYGEKAQPYDTAYLLFQLTKTNDNGIVLIGGWMPYGKEIRIWMAKTDSLGNLLWEQSYGSGIWYYQGHSVIQTTDGGYAIGGFVFEIGNDNSGDPIVIKTDSLGNQEWMKNLGGPYQNYKAMLSLSDDGNIIVGTNYADYMMGDEPYTRVNIIKLDNAGNIIWNKKYGESSYRNFLLNIKAISNGDLLATGFVGSIEPWRSGWILRTNTNGDSLWYREYTLIDGENSMNFLFDIIENQDLELIACGYISPSIPDTGSQDAWVIKLDSIGCEYPFCDTTVGIQYMVFSRSEGFSVYPNPAGEMLTFEFQEAGFRRTKHGARITIFDYFGRKAEEIVVPPWQETVQMNVSSWNAGVYVAVLWGENGIVGREKIVVVRGKDNR